MKSRPFKLQHKEVKIQAVDMHNPACTKNILDTCTLQTLLYFPKKYYYFLITIIISPRTVSDSMFWILVKTFYIEVPEGITVTNGKLMIISLSMLQLDYFNHGHPSKFGANRQIKIKGVSNKFSKNKWSKQAAHYKISLFVMMFINFFQHTNANGKFAKNLFGWP